MNRNFFVWFVAVLMLTFGFNVVAAQASGDLVGTVGSIDVSWFSAPGVNCGTTASVSVYTNVPESRDGQGTRIEFRISGGVCDGKVIGRSNGSGNNGVATGIFKANDDVYAIGVDFFGNPAIWTPRQINEGIWNVRKSVGVSANGNGEACVNAGNFSAQLAPEGRIGQGQRIAFFAGNGCMGNTIGRSNGAGNNALGYHSMDNDTSHPAPGTNTNPDALRYVFVINGVPYALIEPFQAQRGPLMLVAPREALGLDNGGIKGVVIVETNLPE